MRSGNPDFMEKNKAFLSANIPLYKLNHNYIKNLFHGIGHSFLSETTCRKKVLQLSTDDLWETRNALCDKQIFLGKSAF